MTRPSYFRVSIEQFSIEYRKTKLALVASFLNSKFKRIVFALNEATGANLQVNKRTLKWRTFWNKVCRQSQITWTIQRIDKKRS